jgi:murein DD-endopeptidase MepM/ murein hydrolase activator NlpD
MRTSIKKFGSFALVFFLLTLPLALPRQIRAETVSEINEQIRQKQQRISELKQQIDQYQRAITQKQGDASSLKNQIGVLDDKIAQAELDIKANQLKLDTTTLQVQSLTLDIGAKERDLSTKRMRVAELLRQLNREDQRSLLEVLALNSSLGQFFEQLYTLGALQKELQRNINQVESLKAELEHRQSDLANYRSQLLQNKDQLTGSKTNLASQQQTKQGLLKQTKLSEAKFQSLLFQAVQEEEAANRDITALENQVRKRLNLLGPNGLDQFGDTSFSWPVNPSRGISTYFHDPGYIFRKYFEHPAIDIPTPQGSPIRAAASGYVARAKDAGLGYSYIMIVHKGGLATVYGHVNKISVQEETFVTQGQIIGASGGLPGTRGAGPLTTGPHLHFEIRSNGIPVNPLEYLP